MNNYLNVIASLILLSSFVLMANKRITSCIKTFRFQSALIAIAAGILGFKSLYEEGSIDILVVCLIIIALKVIYIPNLLNKANAKVEYTVEKNFFLNIPMLILVCCALVIFSYFSISPLISNGLGEITTQVANSVAIVLIGMFFMISRKKAIGQVVGFLVIENGLFVTAMFSTHGMPLIVDMGVFIDLITAVLIMGLMVFRINEKFESIDINKLNKLRG